MFTDKKRHLAKRQFLSRRRSLIACLILVIGSVALPAGRASAAACSAPATDYGTATSTITVPGTATYRLWTRMYAPDTTDNTYLLEVDGMVCFMVGGGPTPAAAWTWVDYHSGNTTNKIQMSLTAGAPHTIKLIGNVPGVKIDRIVAVSDLNCVPSGFGDNCSLPDDATPPSVTLTSPAENATLSGSTKLTASATDNVGVKKVEFYDNSSLIATTTTSPYETTWNTAQVKNGTHLITARAYDAAGNMSADSSTVSIVNGDTQAPSQPTNVQATAVSYSSVTVKWTASTDNVGITAYDILRNGVPVKTVGLITEYTDTGLSANTAYEYKVIARDAAGNVSPASAPVNITTPAVPDTQAPSQPTALTGSAVSSRQVNLTWNPSTDNTAVVAYDVYRATGTGAATKIATSVSISFGDTSVRPGTSYTYSVVARDGAGNTSQASATVEVTTPATTKRVSLTGTITDNTTGRAIPYSRVSVPVGKNRYIYQADRYGRYAVYNLTAGQYSVTYSAKGYRSQTLYVNLSDSAVQNVRLQKR